MKLLASFLSLFASMIFLQLSSGAIGPLDALSSHAAGFSRVEIGALGSAHFVGFFIGCWGAPRMMGRVGHVRAFSAFAIAGAVGAMAHPMLIDPTAWALLRIMSGFAIAGCYTIIEAWLQARVTNATRGRVLGVYRAIDLGAALVAQLMIGLLEPAAYLSYNIIAILCCASLLPLTLSKAEAPPMPTAPRLRPLKAIRQSPLGAAAVVVSGTSMPVFRMIGPVYGLDVGLRPDQIGVFLALAILGGAVAQIPVGWIADKYDRRWVLMALSLLSVAICLVASLFGAGSTTAIFATSFLFGLATLSLYSVAAAHANDFAEPNSFVELSAALVFLYSTGAIASPIIASLLIEQFGPGALFGMVAATHGLLAIFIIARMSARPTRPKRRSYAYLPRTSYYLGKLIGRRPQ